MFASKLFKSQRAAIAELPHADACIDRAKAYSGLPYARKQTSDDYLKNELFNHSFPVKKRAPGYVNSGLSRAELELALESPVTPAGASKLIELYRAGHLYTSGKKPGRVQPWLVDYAKSSQQDMLEKSRQLWARDFAAADLVEEERMQQAKEAQARLQNLEGFSETDFTYTLLDQIFWANQGKGDGELIIGGIKVTKTVITYSSNSGKSRSSEVEFRWVNSAGESQTLLKKSAYSNNRRNDASRNWGIPE